MRVASACSLFVFLGLGGLALAQEGVIVDPWQQTVASVAVAQPAAAVGRPGTPLLRGPSAANARPTRPAVVPVGPPLRSSLDPWAFVPPGLAEAGDGIVDPWAAPRGSMIVSRAPRRTSEWAREVPDIVDPWAKGPVAFVSRDPLIVDPWAR